LKGKRVANEEYPKRGTKEHNPSEKLVEKKTRKVGNSKGGKRDLYIRAHADYDTAKGKNGTILKGGKSPSP